MFPVTWEMKEELLFLLGIQRSMEGAELGRAVMSIKEVTGRGLGTAVQSKK